jgi:chorismate synthase
VDIDTKEPFLASIERSDSCAVPAACVVAENVVAWEVARALTEKFSSDTMDELLDELKRYRERVAKF